MNRLPLSVSIISFNEENNISACIEAIRDIAAEIIVVDSHSTDRTVEIAQELGATVYIEKWKGHVAQKNSAFDKCSQPWILALDCDEVVSQELKSAIVEAVTSPKAEGYVVNRRTFFMGKWLDYVWYPDWNLRLVKNGSCRWQGMDPHDSLMLSTPAIRLTGDLQHFSFSDLRDCLERTIRYARTSAESYDRNGRRFSWPRLIINPAIGFIRHFFFKRGFLDGIHGFIISAIHAFYVFIKYAFIFEIQRKPANTRNR